MNLKDFEEEIEAELAKLPKRSKKRKLLEKMYFKMKGKKILAIGDNADDLDIDEKKKEFTKEVKNNKKLKLEKL